MNLNERRQERKRELVILKYVASMHEDSITKCIKICCIIGMQGDRE
jgi:hypothetical protein